MSGRDEDAKSVKFFQLQAAHGSETFGVRQVDWRRLLAGFAKRPLKDRTIGSFVFDPDVRDDSTLLGVHKPLDLSFMTQLEGTRVSDLMEESAKRGETFAHSTAVRFMETGNAVAVVRGGRDSPYHSSLEQLATTVAPFEGADRDKHWKIVPLVVQGEVEKFEREAKGMTAFEAKFRTVPDLFSQEPQGGFSTLADQLAQQVHGEFEVKLSVRLLKKQSGDDAARRFRGMFGRERQRLGREQNPLRAKIMRDGGAEEWIDLVSHQLADSLDISEGTLGERRLFSTLMDHLDDVGGDYEDRVKTVLNGG